MNKIILFLIIAVLCEINLYSENWEPFLLNYTYQYSINQNTIITFTFTNPLTLNNDKKIYSHKYVLNKKNNCYNTLMNNSSILRFIDPFSSIDSIIYNDKYIFLHPKHKISLLDSVNSILIVSDTNKAGEISISKYVIIQKLSTTTFNFEDSLFVIDKYDSKYYDKKLQYIGSIKLSKKFGFLELVLPYTTGLLKLMGLGDGIGTFGKFIDTKLEIQKTIAQLSSRRIGDEFSWYIYSHPNFQDHVIRVDSTISIDFIDSVLSVNTYTESFKTKNGFDYYLISSYYDKIEFDLKYLKAILESDTFSWILPPKFGLPYFKVLDIDDDKGLSVIHGKDPLILLKNGKISNTTSGFGLYVNPISCKFTELIDEGNSITFDSEVGISKIDFGWDTMTLLGIKKSDSTKIGNFFKPNSVNENSNLSLSHFPKSR